MRCSIAKSIPSESGQVRPYIFKKGTKHLCAANKINMLPKITSFSKAVSTL